MRREREKREAFALVEQATDILFRSKKIENWNETSSVPDQLNSIQGIQVTLLGNIRWSDEKGREATPFSPLTTSGTSSSHLRSDVLVVNVRTFSILILPSHN